MARNSSRTTTDHEEIRRWAEERDAQPAEVEGTERSADDTGIIRLDFPGYAGTPPLRHISWDEWFRKFDESGLALVYQETTTRGQKSNFNKLVGRETAAARERGETRASRRGAARSGRGAGARRSAGRASARSRQGTGRTRRTARRATREGQGRGGRREAPRAAAGRVTGRRGTGGRSGRSGARTKAASTRSSGSSGRGGGRGRAGARRGGRRTTSRSR